MLYYCMFSRKGETMDTYYEDILKKVEALIKEGQYENAYAILDEELSMPYIPKEYEEPLIAYFNQCRSECKWKDNRVYREEDIETLLNGSLEEAFLAIEQLKNSNIRNHMDVIQDYLKDNPHYLVRSLLIEAMMEQNISDEVCIDVDGLEVRFCPCSIDAPMDSEGAILAVSYLKEWFENDNPTFTMMCVETLVKEAYLRLPFEIEEDDALAIACSVAAYVYAAHEELEAWKIFEEEKGLAQYRGYELLLRKHGM